MDARGVLTSELDLRIDSKSDASLGGAIGAHPKQREGSPSRLCVAGDLDTL